MSAREFAGPLFAQQHSPTSLEAAHQARESGLAERGRELVWAALSGAGASGLTDEQIAQVTRLNPSTARPRRIELLRAGRIIDSGTRLTASGRKAVVWMIR
jgi:hypothetical protein